MNNIYNPVIRGFNPDPSLTKAKGKYYIATSTFQWYPGVRIYESVNCYDWTFITSPLTEELDFNLEGIEDSAGIFAPNLTYHDDTFYLTYTIVTSLTAPYFEASNYLIKTKDIRGPWTKQKKITEGSFDPFLFFEDDKVYYIAKAADNRWSTKYSHLRKQPGIILMKLDSDTFTPISEPINICYGTGIGSEEGPQLIKRNDYYYLILAEGGTVYDHQVSVFRAKSITGPYQVHPQNPILKSEPADYLQKSGHMSITNFNSQCWLAAYLCSRPIKSKIKGHKGEKMCPLGRETAIGFIEFRKDWPYFMPITSINDALPSNFQSTESKKCNMLNISDFQSPRSDTSKANHFKSESLTMIGKSALSSKFNVNFLARRISEFNTKTEIDIEFNPTTYKQMSGIAIYYDSQNYLSLFITHDYKYGRCLRLEAVRNNVAVPLDKKPKSIEGKVRLGFKIDYDSIESYIILDGVKCSIGERYNFSYLSDDYILKTKGAFFTGSMVGMYTTDLSGNSKQAKFTNYLYVEEDEAMSASRYEQ